MSGKKVPKVKGEEVENAEEKTCEREGFKSKVNNITVEFVIPRDLNIDLIDISVVRKTLVTFFRDREIQFKLILILTCGGRFLVVSQNF